MATKNIVPRADNEGSIGTTAKKWGGLQVDGNVDIIGIGDGSMYIAGEGAASNIHIVSEHTAGEAIKIECNGNAGSILNIDAGILDIDVTGASTLNAAAHVTTTTGISTIDAGGQITILAQGNASDVRVITEHLAGTAFHLDANANAGSIVDIDAGILDIDVTGTATIDGATISIDGTDDSNINVTGSGKALAIGVAGGGAQVLSLTSAGTGTNAIDINATAGGLDADIEGTTVFTTTGAQTFDCGGKTTILSQGSASDISIVTEHLAGVAFHLDANANAASEVQIDAGILDMDVTGSAFLDAATVSIDGTDDSNINVTGSGKDLTVGVVGGGAQVLSLTSAGTGVNAIDINATAGGLDVDVEGATVITTVGAQTFDSSGQTTIMSQGNASDIRMITEHTAGLAFHIDADADAGSEVKIDAGILDLNALGAASLDGTTISIDGTDDSNIHVTGSGKDLSLAVVGGGAQVLSINSAGTGTNAIDINATAGGLDVDVAGATAITSVGAQYFDSGGQTTILSQGNASDVRIITEHLAGVAFHLDADANAGSIVDIDAGVLDIDVTGASTITSGTTVDIEGTVLTLDAATTIELEGNTNITGVVTTTGSISLEEPDCTFERVAAGAASIEGNHIKTQSLTIKVLPNEFKNNPDSGRPAMVHDAVANTLSVRGHAATDDFYAFVEIPPLFKVTHVNVHASANTSNAATILPFNYQTGATNAVASTSATFNTNQAVTNIPSSATQDLVIKCTPGANTIFVYGATVTLALI
tara:strand:- start:586 stop:2877 length:2292 start_codon:yes stop_codon:yes gene_type:complete